MKGQEKLLLTCSVAATIATLALSAARAADQDVPAAVGSLPWWFHGEIEIGGRIFANNPQRNGLLYLGQNSLAKYYEYSTVKPGPFGNFWISTGSRDGLYQVDAGGKNVGYSDQHYYFDVSKAGHWYFNGIWDQTPHVYSTSAQTIYGGIGTNQLFIPGGVRTSLFGAAPGGAVQNIINSNLWQTDIGIRRDTAAVEYRWTPTDAWDFKADYSHMRRQGTQVQGMMFTSSSSGIMAELPAPVNDSTQNFGVNGEYAGTSLWGKKFNLKIAYNGSIYKGDASYDADNPFFDPATPVTGNPPGAACTSTACNPAFGRMSLQPDNNANMFTSTVGADLPLNSRYMGTVSYTTMRQNDPYQTFTPNNLITGPINGKSVTSPAALPFASLNGSVDTILVNNVLTTQITPNLKSKLAYRYYDYSNGTPPQFFGSFVSVDAAIDAADPKKSIPVSYTKENALAELTWTPWRGMTLGGQYGYEKYNWSFNDADETNENLGKVYLVHRLNSWMTTRGSWQYSERRYGIYTNDVQRSLRGGWNENYRSPMLANRDQNLGKFQVDVVVTPTVMVSPFGGLKLQDYQTDAFGAAREVGILKDHSWNAGAEIVWTPTRRTQVMASYTYDDSEKRIVGGVGTIGPATTTWDSNINDKVHTFTAALKQTLIEDKLDLKVSYVYSLADGTWITAPFFYNGYIPAANPSDAPNPNYPDTRSSFHRLDALATYKFDQSYVRQMGWTGEVLLKLRYAWERNGVDNWQNQAMQPYMFPYSASTGSMIWLAWNNPNYNVHLLAAALALRW